VKRNKENKSYRNRSHNSINHSWLSIRHLQLVLYNTIGFTLPLSYAEPNTYNATNYYTITLTNAIFNTWSDHYAHSSPYSYADSTDISHRHRHGKQHANYRIACRAHYQYSAR
jgi:hypothetical protein